MSGPTRTAILGVIGIGLLAGCNAAVTQEVLHPQSARFQTYSKPDSQATPVAAVKTAKTGGLHNGEISRVTRTELGHSWHQGCPTPPSDLRRIVVRYQGFDGKQHLGRLVVNVDAIKPVETAMATLDRDHFPITSMIPVSNFGGKDNRSMKVDNTSAFNCRYAKANGVKHWSEHAYGEAIDVNPQRNPYVFDGTVLPKDGTTYADRNHFRPGMIEAGSKAEDAFIDVGWGWGGRWSAPDYQHFSATGT